MFRGTSVDISEYGLIGNCRSAALVSREGSLAWCCLPKFDSEALFSSLLDSHRGGSFSVTPKPPFHATQTYLDDTNVLETRFESDDATLLLHDCFTVADENEKRQSLWPDTEVLRCLECTRGSTEVVVRFHPKGNYGERSLPLKRIGTWGITAEWGRKLLLLQSSAGVLSFSIDSVRGAYAILRISSGEKIVFSLSYSDIAPAIFPPLGDAAFERMDQTKRYWRNWIGRCRYDGPYASEVRRSALALKLLTYAPSGAIVAAPTTSLPEWPGNGRNWDYRFCWLRDASFTVRALVSLGFAEEAVAYVAWLLHATALTHPKLQVVYSVYGETKLKERSIDFLEGFKDSRPVRAGNAASDQFQLDVFGEVIDGLSSVLPYLGGVDKDTRSFVLDSCRLICDLWRTPDQGIWEIRGAPRHYTHSKVMAWVALDRALKMAEEFSWKIPREKFQTTLQSIRDAVESYGFDEERKSYTQSFGNSQLDASVLAMPLVHYCDPASPRMLSTLDAIERHLSKDGLVYRYAPGSDGLGGQEGSFGICTFWMAEARIRAGQREKGMASIKAMLSRRNSLGLWSEEIDPETNQYLGNYPQGFTHIGFVNAMTTLTQTLPSERAA